LDPFVWSSISIISQFPDLNSQVLETILCFWSGASKGILENHRIAAQTAVSTPSAFDHIMNYALKNIDSQIGSIGICSGPEC